MSSVIISGDTSGAITVSAPAVSGTNTLTLQAATATNAINKLETAVASTSGTSIDFTSLPAWCKKITVMFSGVSTNGTSNILLQLGDAGGVENTGYTSRSQTTGSSATSTAGFILTVSLSTSADTFNGAVFLNFLSSNTWTESAIINHTGQNVLPYSAGVKTLSDTLTQLRITTTGADTFDAGTINLLLEG